MEEDNKLPLKRVELSLTKFNEVAIPHHLDLLRQHKANIIKYEQLGQYARVRSEQTHARRVAAQLRSLLGELEALRRQVRAADVPRFDRLTERARDHTLRAIMDYLDSSPMSISREARGADAAASTDSVGLVAHCAEPEQIQLQVDEKELELRSREAALRGWRELQREVRALHEAWQHVQAAALASRDQVSAVAHDVHSAAHDVHAARSTLAAAERLKAGAYGVCGALAGALLAGPAGVLLGVKAGLAVGLAASGLGYLGGAGLARVRRPSVPALPPPDDKKQL
nr:uncharacterized protein LOC117994007 [Maniola hyperantus]